MARGRALVRLEAITVRLFETGPQKYALPFERLLPLPAERELDMTVREWEARQRAENTARRPAVLPLLINEGKLTHDQQLWIAQSVQVLERSQKPQAYDRGADPS